MDLVRGNTGANARILKSGRLKKEDYKQFWATLLDGKTVSREIINRAKDGRILYIESTANPVLDNSGKIIGFLAIQRDISERKKAQEQLQIEKAYLEQLFSSAPEAIVVIDTDGAIIRINNEFTKIFGYPPQEAIVVL